MSEHTPGPWRFDPEPYRADRVYSTTGIVAQIVGDSAETEANALLIAAAPELLEALKEGLALKGGWRAAIVELEDWCSERVILKTMLAAVDQLDRWAEHTRAAIAKSIRS